MPSKPKKLPSGNYRCFAYLGKDKDGKRIRKSITADTAKKAAQLAAQAEAEFDSTGIRPGEDASSTGSMTLGEAMERYIAAKNQLSPTTITGYLRIKKNYYLDLQKQDINALTLEMIQAATSAEAQKVSAKTVRNAHGFLSAVLAMFRPGLALNTALPQKKGDEVVIPDLVDIRAMVTAAEKSGDNDMALAILLAYQMGLRRSEICALTLSDIRGQKILIRKAMVIDKDNKWCIKEPKSTSGNRTIPMTDDVLAALEGRDGDPGDRLLTINPDTLSSRFEDLRNRLGLPHFRFHDLRHYNASVMISLNIPFFYITRRLGHKSTDMVMRVYGHILANKQDDINNQLNAFFSPKGTRKGTQKEEA